MTQSDIEVLKSDIHQMRGEMVATREQLNRIEGLARETNGRVRELEVWRARLQGAASTSRVVWLVAGGGVTAVAIEILRGISS
jgi:hypothetical protein